MDRHGSGLDGCRFCGRRELDQDERPIVDFWRSIDARPLLGVREPHCLVPGAFAGIPPYVRDNHDRVGGR